LGNCYNSGAISVILAGSSNECHQNVGGISGSGNVTNSYNTGSISVSGASVFNVGGVSGNGNAYSSYNIGRISVSDVNAFRIGGISGDGVASNCYNMGTISAAVPSSNIYRQQAGGISGTGNAINCYNLGGISVSGAPYLVLGGISGGITPSVTNSYSLNLYGSAYGTQLTSAQMKDIASFIGWDFSVIWDIDPTVNGGYPFFRDMPGGGDPLLPPGAELSVWSESSLSYLKKGETRKFFVALIKDNQFLPSDLLGSTSVVAANSSVANITSVRNLYDRIEITIKGGNVGSTFVTVSDSSLNQVGYFPIHVYEQDENCYFNGDVPDFWQSGMYVADFSSEKKPGSDGDYIITMDIYNQGCNHGALEIYDADGNLIKSVMISAFNDGFVTGIDETIASYATLIKAIGDGNLTDIKSETYAKKTHVSEETVPKGGFILISNDTNSSKACLLYNTVDIAVSVISKALSLNFSNSEENVKKKMVQVIMDELVKNPGDKVKKALSALIKEMNKKASYLDTKTIFTAFEALLDSLNLDFQGILVSAAKEFGIDIAEGLLLKLTPYGWAVDSIYKVSSYIKLGKMMDACNQNNGSGCATIYVVQTGNTRISNGVKAEGIFDVNTILRTFVVTTGDMHDDIIQTKSVKLYDISLVRDGKEVQPSSKVKVYIPVPSEDWAWFNIENLKIYRVVRNGDKNSYERIESYVEGSYIVFETDHFSYYAIVDGELSSAPGTDQKQYFKLWGKVTRWEKNFWNWILLIVCFGWIWMAS